MSSVGEGVMSRRCNCIGVITKRGSPLLVYSLARSSFNQWVPGLIPGGSKGIVNLFGAGMPRDNYW